MATQVTIRVEALPLVSFAMAHNKIRLVRRILVEGLPVGIENLTVAVRISERGIALSAPCEADLPIKGAVSVEMVPDLALAPAAMWMIEDDRPGELTVQVSAGDQVLGEYTQQVLVLAAREWQYLPQNPELSQELLGSFVMPNDPAVTALVAEARVLLEQRTTSSATEGYQSGAKRVDEIVEAIWDAMRARNIAYSNPPSSWAMVGQKIRTPTEVLDGRAGTCLDTSVVLAAALEHVGINSTVWVLDKHAFLGYWRESSEGRPFSTGVPATVEVAELKTAVDLGVLRMIETTTVTGGEQSASLSSDVHRSSVLQYLGGDLSRIEGVVDVYACRRATILPLPAQTQQPDGTVAVVEYRPAEHSGEHFVPAAREATEATEDESAVDSAGRPIPPRVQRWKNTLLDLSLRNKLINFTETGTIQLAVPDGSIAHVEDVLNAGKPITLLESDAIDQIHRERGTRFGANLPQNQLHEFLDKGQVFTGIPVDGYLTKLRSLAYKAKTIVEETGANNLYLALGSLNWDIKPKQGGQPRAVKSPLILLPVNLVAGKGRGGRYQIVLDDSGTSTPNFCLIEKLRQEEKLRIPALENPVEDEYGIDLAGTFEAVREALRAANLSFHVDETADLAILQFAKFRLWKDLDDSWEQLATSPLVKHMIETPNADYQDPAEAALVGDLDELDASCPIPADASQLEAIAAAVAGKTFVLEGPPGTGKSQTITNLLTRTVVGGKRVLFVAEKRAALDVVSKRMASVGLEPFCLDLHDKASKPAAVRAQILRALDLAVPVDEQGFRVQREDLDTSVRTLDRYAKRLHEKNAAGFSFYSARTEALTLGESTTALPVPVDILTRMTGESIESLRNALRLLPDAADPARPRTGHPWGFVRQPVGVRPDELKAAVRLIDQAVQRLAQSPGAVGAAVDAATSAADVELLHSVLTGPAIALRDIDEVRSRSWADARAQYEQSLATFTAATQPGLDRANPMALNLPLDQIRTQVAAAVASSFFGRKKRLLAALEPLLPMISTPPGRKDALPLIDALLETKARAGQFAPAASGVRGLRALPDWNPWDPASQQALQAQVGWLTAVARAVDPEQASTHPYVAALRSFLEADVLADPTVLQTVADLRAGLADLSAAAPESDLGGWLAGAPLLRTWAAGSAEREVDVPNCPALTRWLTMLAALEPLRAAGLTQARQLLCDGAVETHLAARAFNLGIAEASLVERRAATGLDMFDPLVHNKVVSRFTASATEVRSHLTSVIPMQIVAARPFSSSGDRGQVGALRRELQRQRGGLKVRALLDKYGDLITQLMPCVLVSPDSVSRFFPVGSQMFDVVVFDEASQIRVADAIGAIGRARSVVIVGDSKQMPPTSVAEAAVEDDEVAEQLEGFIDAPDQESILSEAGQAGLRSKKLTWHYRSRDETLIAFSNEHYYANTLSSFPTPAPPVDNQGRVSAGLSLIRVQGTFLRSGVGKMLRTNPVEAEAIVAEIRRRFAMSPEETPSIGVVTFNTQQRTLIDTMLRDGGDERIIEALEGTNGEGLFIKNLENVQGDERDLILFSIAFSKNDNNVLPLNFGPLGLEGGERRLNVAVTRARQQVIIYASFDPGELRAGDTKHLGIKHLRDYLELAVRGSEALAGTAGRQVVDRHRDELAAALRSRGLVATTDIGLSDFKIDLALATQEAPEDPIVAVLLDGEGWASRRTVGDRDGLPVAVLGGLMGWKAVERVWLPEWLADQNAVLDRLSEAVRRALANEPAAPVPASVGSGSELASTGPSAPPVADAPTRDTGRAYTSAPSLSVPAIKVDEAMPGATPYVRWPMQSAGDVGWLDNLSDPRARSQVGTVIAAILAAESPVQLQRLGKLAANAFGLSRVTPARIEAITSLVPLSSRDGFGFVWRDPADLAGFTGFRTATGDEPRVLEEIHPLEIANAMVAVSRAAWGIGEDDLYADTLAQFGWKRRTTAAVSQLSETLKIALADGMLERGDDGLIRAR